MKVKEVMARKVKSLSAEMGVREGMDLLFELGMGGLPVIDENKKLAGVFTEKGVLAKILPSYVDKVGGFVYGENPKAVRQKVHMLKGMKVAEVMFKDAVTVNEDATLCEAARIMITKEARRIPVVDANNEVTGIVTREDILKAMLSEYQEDSA
ncbi:HPP family protein [Candidatus Omnitrophota bacterium]